MNLWKLHGKRLSVERRKNSNEKRLKGVSRLKKSDGKKSRKRSASAEGEGGAYEVKNIARD